jgi:hypothetical protein
VHEHSAHSDVGDAQLSPPPAKCFGDPARLPEQERDAARRRHPPGIAADHPVHPLRHRLGRLRHGRHIDVHFRRPAEAAEPGHRLGQLLLRRLRGQTESHDVGLLGGQP